MDKNRRDALVSKLKVTGAEFGAGPGPVVLLDEFFEGNDDFGSIGCNLASSPGPQGFYEAFRRIELRPDVQGVYVEIRDLMDDGHSWPFSYTIHVLGKISAPELWKFLRALQPDEIGPFPAESIPKDLPQLQPGMSILSVW